MNRTEQILACILLVLTGAVALGTYVTEGYTFGVVGAACAVLLGVWWFVKALRA